MTAPSVSGEPLISKLTIQSDLLCKQTVDRKRQKSGFRGDDEARGVAWRDSLRVDGDLELRIPRHCEPRPKFFEFRREFAVVRRVDDDVTNGFKLQSKICLSLVRSISAETG